MNHLHSTFLLVAALLVGCGGDSSKGSRSARSGKDRGAAAMTMGTAQWQASNAKARLANGKLIINATNMDHLDGKVQRQELTLSIADYKGPGEYTTDVSGSRFIGVGINVAAAKAAGEATQGEAAKDGTEQAATKVLTDALSGSKHVLLSNAKVTITAASSTEISGTFSWQPLAGMKQPAIQDGTFRALVKE